ncbi:MAG TPA: GH116 family glycosyl-hydrolase [Candidatus Dormibacteraeota bacterium]|nr:GH116 family glycosyl-hydrolase [Candidatus Dormibacteraeota bacterium]
MPTPAWPSLRSYTGEQLRCVALPLGGIGTGTVSLGGRGQLCDWEIMNRPAKGFVPQSTFFVLRARSAGREAVMRVLEGALLPPYDGARGSTQPAAGLPRFRSCAYHTAYPFAEVRLRDAAVPVRVALRAFNPLVPGDVDASSLPVAVLRFSLSNPTRRRVEATVCGSIQNIVGFDGAAGKPDRNRNTPRRDAGLSGLLLSSDGVPPQAEQWGTIALATTSPVSSQRTAWAQAGGASSGLLDFWDDLSDDGRLDERQPGPEDAPMASLAASVRLDPGATRELTFLLAWHFPNRMAPGPRDASSCGGGECTTERDRVGNHYATRFADAWQVARHVAAELGTLERRSRLFVDTFLATDLPAAVKEAALFTLPALRSQTSFRSEEGHFHGFEGCDDREGCCHGTCTHVWNYEHASALLFGSLSRSMRELEFLHATRDDGRMSFRIDLPLHRATAWDLAAADGQMGCVMKLHRDWRLSGDEEMLRSLWPRARRAMEFCWVPGGWDADRDGVMEGCQHTTMDVEYFGPNPEVGFWYLGALRAAEEMARHLGDGGFAATCRALYERGSAFMDSQLYNGEYYEHRVAPPRSPAEIAAGLRGRILEELDPASPDLQPGRACLADQTVGQLMAHLSGLGHLASPAHLRTTLRTLMRHNFGSLHGHANHMRTYALGDERGMLVATYPRGGRPRRPLPYLTEVWTGIEYTAAAHMACEGLRDAALRCVEAARARHDGARRNPYDDAECGHHYARAMAAWALVPAFSGVRWSGVDGSFEVAAGRGPSTHFWSNGDAWGTVEQSGDARTRRITLRVLHGRIDVGSVTVSGHGRAVLPRRRAVAAPRSLSVDVPGRAPRGA